MKRLAECGGSTMTSTGRRPPSTSSRSRRASMRLSLIMVQTQKAPDSVTSKTNSETDANRRRHVVVVGKSRELIRRSLSTTAGVADDCSLQSSDSALAVRRAVSVPAVTAPITTVCRLSCTPLCRCSTLSATLPERS